MRIGPWCCLNRGCYWTWCRFWCLWANRSFIWISFIAVKIKITPGNNSPHAFEREKSPNLHPHEHWTTSSAVCRVAEEKVKLSIRKDRITRLIDAAIKAITKVRSRHTLESRNDEEVCQRSFQCWEENRPWTQYSEGKGEMTAAPPRAVISTVMNRSDVRSILGLFW